jgi:hypothetical protein
MTPRAATSLLIAAVALVVGAAGGAWLAAGREPARAVRGEAPAAVAAPAEGDLAAVLGELSRTLEALRTTLAERPIAAPAPSASPPGASAERVPLDAGAPARYERELVAALNALAASLRGLQADPARSASPRAQHLIVPKWVDRRAAFASAGMRAAQVADDEVGWDRAMEAWRDKHFFWTAQQVLDAYGKPDEIEAGEGQASWTYRLQLGEDAEEWYYFRFADGLVYAVEYDGS